MMSDKVMLSPVITRHNAIAITDNSRINFRLAIRQVDSNGVKSLVQLKNGLSSDGNTFVALFDDNDIDFDIKIDNRSALKNIGFDINYDKKYEYFIRRGSQGILQALETNGHHLRFLSPNLRTAQMVVDLVANEGVDRKKAEMICSRIRFDVRVEKSKSNVVLLGPKIEIFVAIPNGNTIAVRIGRDNTGHDLNRLIRESEGIPVGSFRMIYNFRRVDERQTMRDIGVERHSTIEVYVEQSGGGDDSVNIRVKSQSRQEFGRRGVVGFGHKTDQWFKAYRGFVADEHYIIEPFFIEFRLKK